MDREDCAKVFDLHPRVTPLDQLRVNGVGRDKDHDRALCFYFNRPATDAELRFLNECMQRSAALMPRNLTD